MGFSRGCRRTRAERRTAFRSAAAKVPAHIAYIQADAVDGKPVRLAPLDVTPDSVKQVGNVGAAGATSLTGAILLGPVGLAAGALIHGGNVSLPAGAVGTSSVEEMLQISVL